MLDQDADGSWNRSAEETSYKILALCEVRRLPIFKSLHQPLHTAIEQATVFLKSSGTRKLNYLWIEKSNLGISPIEIPGYVQLFQQTPMFSSTSQWKPDASIVEGMLFQPLLWARRSDIFQRENMGMGKYLDLISLT
ncbi:hypothetical protein F4677DRAFT_441530 [Hypoxylon crocopeplum]|nr:hypothetical protein F4677DRAFT_441530 [Hypoxylon crocopeplum]